jgi:hypothetical protein
MKFIIKPKFQIGQKIWLIDHFCSECKEGHLGCGIKCNKHHQRIVFPRIVESYRVYSYKNIQYYIKGYGCGHPLPERLIFRTEKDALRSLQFQNKQGIILG